MRIAIAIIGKIPQWTRAPTILITSDVQLKLGAAVKGVGGGGLLLYIHAQYQSVAM